MRFPIILAIAIAATCVSPHTPADNRAIYRCEVNGILVFSDRPCAPTAALVELDTDALNTYESPPVQRSQIQPKQRKSSRQEPDPATALRKRKEACERIVQSLKDIRSKMRAGYKASEGERLRERQKRLTSQLRSARCG